jgi:hypothetical protein
MLFANKLESQDDTNKFLGKWKNVKIDMKRSRKFE